MVTTCNPHAQQRGSQERLAMAVVSALTLLLAACARGGGPPPPNVEPALEAVTPLAGDNYAFVYQEGSELRRINTSESLHQRLLGGVDELLLATAGPTGDQVAVAYRFGDSSRMLAVNTASGATVELHRGAGSTSYTAAWDVDGHSLGVGFHDPNGHGGILVFDGTDVRNIGCSASNRFVAWRSPSQVIVGDAANDYTVSTSDCATLARLQRAGKDALTFAANGRRAAWLADRTVEFANRAGAQAIPQLWIAENDGSAARLIADYQSRPSEPAWAPDAGMIAYVVASRRWANTTHVVAFDVRSGEYTYIAQEMPLGVPIDFGVCWAPNGERFAHDRVYRRSSGAQAYVTHQIVVRQGETEKVVFDEIISRDYQAVIAQRPEPCRWMGNHSLLVAGVRGQEIIDVDADGSYDVPVTRRVLAAIVYEGSR
jgi:hypothetical protein